MWHLADAWMRTMRRLGARDDVSGAGARLLAAYADPSRHYHSAAHLDDMLRQIDDLAAYATDADSVRVAAWFHDAVYDPRAGDNEERSAILAERTLSQLRVAPPVIAEVARLVRLTVTHAPDPEDSNGTVLCDADLAVLAADDRSYAAYVAGVRAEYAHVDDSSFAAGRATVLRRFLARPAIYRTPYAVRQWEQRARENLTRELLDLSP
jgi:predicted metal-dependent HD superfamily phosphohydrolase